MLSIVDGLIGQARQHPERVAVVCAGEEVTFAELRRRAEAGALLLWEAGLRPGDRVATLLPNGLTAVELLFAAAWAGVVLCPMNPASTPAELAYLLADARPRLLVGVPPVLEAAQGILPPGLDVLADAPGVDGYAGRRDAVPPRPFPPLGSEEAPWLLVYTSGTTGRPKGALRSQRSDYLLGLVLAPAVGIGSGDVGLAILPLYHVNSIWVVTLSICLGATCHIHAARRFVPGAMLAELERCQATYAMFVPTLLGFLADALEAGQLRCPHLRVLLTSSAPLAPVLRDRLLAHLPEAHLVEIYGATELGAVTMATHAPGQPSGSIGFPLPGVRVHLLGPDRRPVAAGEVGELYAEGPLLMEGYFGRPGDTDAATAGRAVSAGDLARSDTAGRLYLADRVSDTIITSGENVYPSEVEGVLLAHPAVALCAVVGVPDERRGEAVAAAVVRRPGQAVTAADLAAHCRTALAPHKCPRLYAFAAELPLGVAGKVLRRRVREDWGRGVYVAAGGG